MFDKKEFDEIHSCKVCRYLAFIVAVIILLIVLAFAAERLGVHDEYPETQTSAYYEPEVANQFTSSELGTLLLDSGVSKIVASLEGDAGDCSEMMLRITQGGATRRDTNYETAFNVADWPKSGDQCISTVRLSRSVTMGEQSYHLYIDAGTDNGARQVNQIEMAKLLNAIGNSALLLLADVENYKKEIADNFKVDR